MDHNEHMTEATIPTPGSVTRLVALLRGINVGGRNRVEMARLRQLAENVGYADVRTHLNTGNLLLTPAAATEADADRVAAALAAAITAELGLNLDVTVRSRAQLATILAADPFPDGDPSQVTVAFLTGPPPPGATDRVLALAAEHEPVVFADREVWVNYTQGIGDSRLAAGFVRAVGVSATVRNVRTARRLLELMGG